MYKRGVGPSDQNINAGKKYYMEISSTMIITLAAAFAAGIVLFVVTLRVISELKKERHLIARRKTTSLHIAKVVSAAADAQDETASGVSVIQKTEEELSSESVDAGSAEDIADESADGSADNSADEPVGDSVDESADDSDDDSANGSVDESADEQTDDTQSDYKSDNKHVNDDSTTADSAAKPVGTARQGLADSVENDSDEETRETQAVSLADIMASDSDEDKPAAVPQDAPAETVSKVKPVQSIHMQPIKPLRTLQPVEEKVDGGGKIAGVNKRRLPETVKMKERRVLLAEDVKVHRELIEMFFQGSGVKFEFAENGVEACDMFLSSPDRYSLILMDIHMPVMDGYEAAKKIRAMDIDWAKQIPIVAMTADTTEDDIGRCFEAGMDDHIVKPIDMAILQDRVFEFVTRDLE